MSQPARGIPETVRTGPPSNRGGTATPDSLELSGTLAEACVETNYKVLLELGGDLPVDRLCLLLETIDRLGSINRGAAELRISYRYAWGLTKKAEDALGSPLLRKRVGGAEGGGAELTGEARDLLGRYRQFRTEVGGRVGDIFDQRWLPQLAVGSPPQGESEGESGGDNGGEPPLHIRLDDTERPLLLASTIGPVEAGILGALGDGFHRDTGIVLRYIAAGTGQALGIARDGRVDLVLTHAPQMEEEFIAQGFGAGRYPLMYNSFLLTGPASDPAGAGRASSAEDAFRRIAASNAPFISRGDRSGTHVKELSVWEAAGLAIRGPWYRVHDRGAMGSTETLRFAERSRAYTLVDRATYLSARADGTEMVPFIDGDPLLRNEFSLIPVSPRRFPRVRFQAARRFVEWATGPEGQGIIEGFGCERCGEPLFFPAVRPFLRSGSPQPRDDLQPRHGL